MITGNEPGKFYYVVLPKALGEEAEKESGGMTTKFILSRVTSHYGIVGYGRVDGAKASNFSFNGLAAETEYVIYSFMTDDAEMNRQWQKVRSLRLTKRQLPEVWK